MNRAEKKCFSLIQEIVTLRDVACQRCGDTPISGHHVFGRRNHGSAFDPDSCIGLCVNCHDGWARKCPDEVHDMLREKIGEERYNHLAYLSEQVVRLRDKDYLAISISLGLKLAELRSI